MNQLALAAAAVALALAGCASTTAPAQDAGQAERKCMAFVQVEGLAVADMGKPAAADGGYRVPVRVQDRLGRRIDNACVISAEQVRWATPLPEGLRTR